MQLCMASGAVHHAALTMIDPVNVTELLCHGGKGCVID